MSKLNETKLLSHGEVQKKIIDSPPRIRPESDLIGPHNKYRDENFEIYERKKKQFLEASKKYNRLNHETLIINKKRLLDDYRRLLDCEFLEDEKVEKNKNEETKTGKLLRKRTERPIHQLPSVPKSLCVMEPWFTRYLKLNKFILAARKIILKNRLLKVLEKLKTVSAKDIARLEKVKPPMINIMYANIFEKFK